MLRLGVETILGLFPHGFLVIEAGPERGKAGKKKGEGHVSSFFMCALWWITVAVLEVRLRVRVRVRVRVRIRVTVLEVSTFHRQQCVLSSQRRLGYAPLQRHYGMRDHSEVQGPTLMLGLQSRLAGRRSIVIER